MSEIEKKITEICREFKDYIKIDLHPTVPAIYLDRQEPFVSLRILGDTEMIKRIAAEVKKK